MALRRLQIVTTGDRYRWIWFHRRNLSLFYVCISLEVERDLYGVIEAGAV